MFEVLTQFLQLIQTNDPVTSLTLVSLAGFGATVMSTLVALAIIKRKK